MSRDDLMTALVERAFHSRISMNAVLKKAGISGTVITRWGNKVCTPKVETIARMERALAAIEQEKGA